MRAGVHKRNVNTPTNTPTVINDADDDAADEDEDIADADATLPAHAIAAANDTAPRAPARPPKPPMPLKDLLPPRRRSYRPRRHVFQVAIDIQVYL